MSILSNEFKINENLTTLIYNNLKLYIEIVICTDYSIYKLHKRILNDYLSNDQYINDTQIIVNHIKAYYTQIINGVRIIILIE